MGQARRSAVVMTAAALVASACDAGGADADRTAASEVAPTPEVAPASSAAPLPADAGAGDIARAVDGILGPSIDPIAAAAALVELPAGLPVPVDAVVIEFHTNTLAQTTTPTSPESALTETSFALWTPAAPEDVATLYRTALPGLGFAEVGGTAPEQLDRTQSWEFESAEVGDRLTLSVQVFDIAAAVADERIESPTNGTQLRLSFVERHIDAVDRYPWWHDLVPVPVRSTQRVAVDTGYHQPRDVVRLTAKVEVAGDVATVTDAFRTEIGEPGRSEVETTADESTFTGEHPELGTVVYTVEPSVGDSVTSVVTIDACHPLRVNGDDLRVTSQYLYWSSCAQSIGAAPPDEFPTPTTLPPEFRAVTGRSATGEELRDAAVAVLGPTDDVVATMEPFVTLPDAFGTPAGADIVWFSTNVDMEEGGWNTADVELIVDGTVGDVATFYETTLATAGYFRMIGERTGTGAEMQADLQFTLEDGEFDDVSEIDITIGSGALIYADAAEPGTPVRISFTRPVVDQGGLAADTWALPMTGLDAAAVTTWSVAVDIVDPAAVSVDLSTTYAVEGDALAALEAIRATPPPGIPLSDTDGLVPDNVWFERVGYESFWASAAEFLSGDQVGISVNGSLLLSGGGAD